MSSDLPPIGGHRYSSDGDNSFTESRRLSSPDEKAAEVGPGTLGLGPSSSKGAVNDQFSTPKPQDVITKRDSENKISADLQKLTSTKSKSNRAIMQLAQKLLTANDQKGMTHRFTELMTAIDTAKAPSDSLTNLKTLAGQYTSAKLDRMQTEEQVNLLKDHPDIEEWLASPQQDPKVLANEINALPLEEKKQIIGFLAEHLQERFDSLAITLAKMELEGMPNTAEKISTLYRGNSAASLAMGHLFTRSAKEWGKTTLAPFRQQAEEGKMGPGSLPELTRHLAATPLPPRTSQYLAELHQAVKEHFKDDKVADQAVMNFTLRFICPGLVGNALFGSFPSERAKQWLKPLSNVVQSWANGFTHHTGKRLSEGEVDELRSQVIQNWITPQ